MAKRAEPKTTYHDHLGRFVAYAVALPVAHLIVASVFLWGYSYGFDSRISAFVDISDIFRVSIADLAYLYLSAFFSLSTFLVYLDEIGPKQVRVGKERLGDGFGATTSPARPIDYSTPHLRERWEAAARANLRRSLAVLRGD